MSHIETLIVNEIKKTLKSLAESGVGYIDLEQSGTFYYDVDGTKIRVLVEKVD